jgi:hypothetical protein
LARCEIVIFAGGAALPRVDWTSEVGAPLAVSLIQGNVAQEIKFKSGVRRRTFDLYTELVASSRGRLVVLPESAFPMFADEVPDAVLLRIIANVVPRNGDAMSACSLPSRPLEPGGSPRSYNSVVTVGSAGRSSTGSASRAVWRDDPARARARWFINPILAIPIASQARGDPDQRPLDLAGQRVAVDICYEDAFGAEIRSTAAEATLLVQRHQSMRGTGARSPRCSTTRSLRCARSKRTAAAAPPPITGITSAIAHDWERDRPAAVVHARISRNRDRRSAGNHAVVRSAMRSAVRSPRQWCLRRRCFVDAELLRGLFALRWAGVPRLMMRRAPAVPTCPSHRRVELCDGPPRHCKEERRARIPTRLHRIQVGTLRALDRRPAHRDGSRERTPHHKLARPSRCAGVGTTVGALRRSTMRYILRVRLSSIIRDAHLSADHP